MVCPAPASSRTDQVLTSTVTTTTSTSTSSSSSINTTTTVTPDGTATTETLPAPDSSSSQQPQQQSAGMLVANNEEEQERFRRRAYTDLTTGPKLDDAEYGEHAAGFLSGNFQPLIEETTAEVVLLHPGGAADNECEADYEKHGGTCSSTSIPGGDAMYVVGELPADFPDGKFMYVGPNPKFSRQHYKVWGEGPGQRDLTGFGNGWHHWFEGDGMVYAVDFEGAAGAGGGVSGDDDAVTGGGRRVRYRNRYVRTNSWHDELRHGSRLFKPLMNASGANFLPHALSNLIGGGDFLKDSANTALTNFAGRLLALQDTMPPWELDEKSLETKGSCDFDGALPFYVPFTAHPKVSPGSGELMFFGFNPVYPPHCSVGSVSPEGDLGPITSLWHNALQGATFMHDFCVTKKYTILFEGSMNIRPLRMLAGKHPLKYDGSQRARFGVMRRREGDAAEAAGGEEVVWCDCCAAEMVYHFVNSWEDDATGEIVVVGVREDGFFHGALAANGTREWIRGTLAENQAVPRMHEWRIDPTKGEVTSERWLFDDVVEVPRINDAYTGVKNRYAYAGRVHTDSLADDAQLKFDAVCKFDLETGKKHTYVHGEGRYGMEQQFVPRNKRGGSAEGAAVEEDDGWLVLYVHDESATGKERAAEGRSECVVLDAKNIEAGPVARLVLPSRVPYGAHSLWCPAEEEAGSSGGMSSDGGGVGEVGDVMEGGTAAAAAAAIKASPPKPRMFAFTEGQVSALLGTVRTGILRAASGLFVNGWRPWLGADKSDEYAFVRALGIRFTEARALGAVREEQAREEERAEAEAAAGGNAAQPVALDAPALTLYEHEGCGGSRRVREAICMLDLACTMKPCPLGAVRHRMEAAAAQPCPAEGDTFCTEDAELPYLEDERTGVALTGADAIVEYLYEEYLDGAAPSPLVAPGPFADARAQFAVDARGGDDSSPSTAAGCGVGSLGRGPAGAFYTRPSLSPDQPLELWAYEASPFCSVVREALSELEIPYVVRPCARGSPRRSQLMRRTGGTFQVPYLEDPNTGVAMFESDEIVKYLRTTYLP